MEAQLHSAEPQRIAALRSYHILDTPREKEFDDIVAVVSAICETPISVVNLIDSGRQWFKAEVGLGVRETPLPASICAHAILQHGLFIVSDTQNDDRFSDNPLVTGDPHLRFYAGALLETSEGLPLGTICVLDYRPRKLNDNQKALLRLMASQIMKLLELRRVVGSERAARAKAELLVRENATLAREVDHRVMNSLQLVSSVLRLQSRNLPTSAARLPLEDAQRRVHAIATVHRQLHLTGGHADIEIDMFLRALAGSLRENAPPNVRSLTVDVDPMRLPSDVASTLGLVVAELVANSFKHAYPSGRGGAVSITFRRGADRWMLSVGDAGVGLPADFDPAGSTGVGMQVVLALTRRLDARLTTRSSPSETAFVVTHETPGQPRRAARAEEGRP